jgi:hypothetical protein
VSREQYDAVRKKIDEVGPFLNLTEHDFSIGTSDQVMRKGKHEAIDRQLRLISARRERAAQKVDDVEQLIGIKTRWQRGDTEYMKVLKYISNRKFVRVIEELQGLVVSRLMELEKVNLAGSGMQFISLYHYPNFCS